jgi:hypothetical protein
LTLVYILLVSAVVSAIASLVRRVQDRQFMSVGWMRQNAPAVEWDRWTLRWRRS